MSHYPFSAFIYQDENTAVAQLLERLDWSQDLADASHAKAVSWVEQTRANKSGGRLEAFLQEFSLNTEEGLAMMTLAEALLRIPDAETANLLIKDKVAAANWLQNQGDGPKDWMTKATGFGMKMTQKTLDGAFSKMGQPIIREAMVKAMQMMGKQFVLGDTIQNAMSNAKAAEKTGYRTSYDILGEAARDMKTADYYYTAYSDAIDAIAKGNDKTKYDAAGISVKLSALYPRFEYSQRDRCVPFITQKLKELCIRAAGAGINLTMDAEEVARLNLSIEIFENVLQAEELQDWNGFGLAVQAYQKRALPLLDYLVTRMRALGRKIHVRLVKGAYWDTEIKIAQMNAYPDYPVFTRKPNTDVSYMACAQVMLQNPDVIHPLFATHNAHTIAAIQNMAARHNAVFELQRLHGMGSTLYKCVMNKSSLAVSIYAPVGPHEDLLPYLVRRLLENGANSSFVNKIMDPSYDAAEIVKDPVSVVKGHDQHNHPEIPMPLEIFGQERTNSAGLDLDDGAYVLPVETFVKNYVHKQESISLIAGEDVTDPDMTHVDKAFFAAAGVQTTWNTTPVTERAAILERFADLMEAHRDTLMAILAHESGKTYGDARDELREAVDFCRYYAVQARHDFDAKGIKMGGYTGEDNYLTLQGRGTFLCISPWNFPLAIFVGQLAAALVAGNTVIAKPASQTPVIATYAMRLLFEAGLPQDVLHLVNVGSRIAAQIVADPRVAGVAFTGSTATAKRIQASLATDNPAIVPLIAETGGQNAMIVDSSALPERVVDDVIHSAFGSTGQRCSALRVLYLQDDIADRVLGLLKGAVDLLAVGDATDLSADIGRVIDAGAKAGLEAHVDYMQDKGTLVCQAAIDPTLSDDSLYFAPRAYEIPSIDILQDEVFGPVLHIIRFKATDMDKVVAEINSTGYGLTFGLQSRIGSRHKDIATRVNAGNLYVNRNTTGAIVGVQPFGGMGLSGTGPKAGGPFYLHAFATEKVVSTDTTAMGGNADLVSLGE